LTSWGKKSRTELKEQPELKRQELEGERKKPNKPKSASKQRYGERGWGGIPAVLNWLVT